jgi:hypothetical protein
MKLPSHTTRHFAAEAYKSYIYNGVYQCTFKTVQGVEIYTLIDTGNEVVQIQWDNGGKTSYKNEPFRKSWLLS